MKNELSITLLLFSICFFPSCSDKKKIEDQQTASEQNVSEDWKEMDDFHMIMADAFHPFKDSSNLAPAKSIAAEMAANAAQWADAPLPKRVNSAEVKEKLQTLKLETAAFEQIVKEKSDAEIGESLTKLHDLFHKIQEEWYHDHHNHSH